ncbi:MAG: phosphoesterase, partial [Legionella sp.]
MAQQPQQQNTDNGMAPIWIMVLLFVTVFIIWKTGHQYIVMTVFQINIWQAKLVNLFIHNEHLTNLIYLMQTVDPNAVDWNQLLDTTRAVGDFMRYPVVFVLLVLAVVLYHSNIALKFRKAHDMKSLR